MWHSGSNSRVIHKYLIITCNPVATLALSRPRHSSGHAPTPRDALWSVQTKNLSLQPFLLRLPSQAALPSCGPQLINSNTICMISSTEMCFLLSWFHDGCRSCARCKVTKKVHQAEVKNSKKGYLRHAEGFIHNRVSFPLIVPMLVIYNGRESNTS